MMPKLTQEQKDQNSLIKATNKIAKQEALQKKKEFKVASLYM